MILNQAKLVATLTIIPGNEGPSAFLTTAGQFPNEDLSEKLQCKLEQWLLPPYSLNVFLHNILPFEEGKQLPCVSAYNFKFKQRALGPSAEAVQASGAPLSSRARLAGVQLLPHFLPTPQFPRALQASSE